MGNIEVNGKFFVIIFFQYQICKYEMFNLFLLSFPSHCMHKLYFQFCSNAFSDMFRLRVVKDAYKVKSQALLQIGFTTCFEKAEKVLRTCVCNGNMT